MRQSRLFSKIEKHDPKDEAARNARLLIRGGFIAKVMAGVYDYLPLGLRVVKKIAAIVREEMDALGAE
ncbi:prolyl-tRNA synthetase, partial [Candidatus Parcubacteria bacterium]